MGIRSSNTSVAAIICSVCSVLLFTPFFAKAETPLSLDEKLAAIRQGLVKAAMEGSTKVHSTVWIDANGSLQESSSFRTGMQVRGVKVIAYGRDESGQPKADLHWQSDSALKSEKPESMRVPSCGAIDFDGRLQHVVGFEINAAEGWDADQLPAVRAATNLLLQQGTLVSSGAVQWKMLLGESGIRTMYEKALLSSSLDQMPWRVNLTLQPVTKQPPVFSPVASVGSLRKSLPSLPPEPGIQLRLTLTARNQSQPAFETRTQLAWRVESKNWSAPQISAESQNLLVQQINDWSLQIHKLLACEPVLPEVILTSNESVRINAGTLAGLHIGDELLLANGKNFIKKILEPGVVTENVIAKVQSVSAHYAQLKVSVGTPQSVQLGWRAWSTDINR